MIREHRRPDVDRISIDHRQEAESFVLHSRRLDRGRPLQAGRAVRITSLVQKIRRKRRCEIQRPHSGVFADLSGISSRPGRRIVVVAIVAFANPRSTQSVFLTEVVIDLDIDLPPIVSIDDFSGSARRNSCRTPHPANHRGIQPIDVNAADRTRAIVRVGQRHGLNDFRDVTGGIETFAERIPGIECITENVEALQWASRTDLRRAQRISELVDNRNGSRRTCTVGNNVGVTVVHSRKEPEDALPRRRCQHHGIGALLLKLVLTIVQSERRTSCF